MRTHDTPPGVVRRHSCYQKRVRLRYVLKISKSSGRRRRRTQGGKRLVRISLRGRRAKKLRDEEGGNGGKDSTVAYRRLLESRRYFWMLPTAFDRGGETTLEDRSGRIGYRALFSIFVFLLLWILSENTCNVTIRLILCTVSNVFFQAILPLLLEPSTTISM